MSAILSLILCAFLLVIFNALILLLVNALVVLDFYNNKWISQKNFEMNKEIGTDRFDAERLTDAIMECVMKTLAGVIEI